MRRQRLILKQIDELRQERHQEDEESLKDSKTKAAHCRASLHQWIANIAHIAAVAENQPEVNAIDSYPYPSIFMANLPEDRLPISH
jgi:hypothetical protein